MAHPFVRRLHRDPPILYALLDTGLVPEATLVDEAGRLAEAGVDVVQLRAKGWGGGAFLERARAVGELLRTAGIPLIVNDRVDVALLAGADGVHVGQEDLPVEHARALLGPERLVGLSTHGPAEIAAAPVEADYLGFGAMYPTGTRADSRVAGPGALTGLRAAPTLPMIAIGGLTPERVEALGALPLAGVAVASAIVPVREHPGAVEAFRRALDRWPPREARCPRPEGTA